MKKQLSVKSRRELVELLSTRYSVGGQATKCLVLDEFVAMTGYHRKHAIRALNLRPTGEAHVVRTRPCRYGNAVAETLLNPQGLMVMAADVFRRLPLDWSSTGKGVGERTSMQLLVQRLPFQPGDVAPNDHWTDGASSEQTAFAASDLLVAMLSGKSIFEQIDSDIAALRQFAYAPQPDRHYPRKCKLPFGRTI